MRTQLVFPLLMIALNVGAAIVNGLQQDFRRALYFLASAVCVLAVSWEPEISRNDESLNHEQEPSSIPISRFGPPRNWSGPDQQPPAGGGPWKPTHRPPRVTPVSPGCSRKNQRKRRDPVNIAKHKPIRAHLNEPAPFGSNPASRYPSTKELTADLAAMFEVAVGNVAVVNGADAAIDAIVRSIPAGEAVTLYPSFPRTAHHIANNRNLVHKKVAIGGYPFRYPIDGLLDACGPQTSLVVLSTVENPVGLPMPDFIYELLRKKAPNAVLVVDGVYDAFIGACYAGRAAQDPGTLAVGSLSKVGGPGLRVGWIVGHAATLKTIAPFVSPFSVATRSVSVARRMIAARGGWPELVKRQVDARNLLTHELERRGIRVAIGSANFVLAYFGAAARRITAALAADVLVSQPDASQGLEGWLRFTAQSEKLVVEIVSCLDALLMRTFTERGGLISFRPEALTAGRVANDLFAASVFGTYADLDHFVVCRPTPEDADRFAADLVARGATILEGPGTWPAEFCSAGDEFPEDLAMRFASLHVPGGGIVVVAAPHANGDQLSRFAQARGPLAVHHIAIRVGRGDFEAASAQWIGRGFAPMSAAPVEDGTLRQIFLRNTAGQVVELIERLTEEGATFTCANIGGLRKSERAAAVGEEVAA